MGHTDVSTEEVETFRRLYAEGNTFYRIAQITGRNRQTISHWVKGPYRASKSGQRVAPLAKASDGTRLCRSCGKNPARYSESENCYRRCEECQSHYYSRYHFRKKYGLGAEDIYAMVEKQQGKCGICGKVPDYPLHVDHDHRTGAIRGLLCAGCNNALGKFGDGIEGLSKAIEYLRRYEEASGGV